MLFSPTKFSISTNPENPHTRDSEWELRGREVEIYTEVSSAVIEKFKQKHGSEELVEIDFDSCSFSNANVAIYCYHTAKDKTLSVTIRPDYDPTDPQNSFRLNTLIALEIVGLINLINAL